MAAGERLAREAVPRCYTRSANPPPVDSDPWAMPRSAPSMARGKSRAAVAPRAAARRADGLGGPSSVLIAPILIALNLVVYAQVRTFGFVNWDDPSYITENPNVAAGLTWHSAW